MNCLDKETVVAYLNGDLDVETARACASHTADCSACQMLIEEISALIDGIREDLLLIDGAQADDNLVPFDVSKRAIRAARATETRSLLRSRVFRWGLVTAPLIVLLIVYIAFLKRSQVVSADEILRLAATSSANASRTLPNRIIFRHWKEHLKNGLGPLPDGNYRAEHWWDNRHNLAAMRRFDGNHVLRQANWVLEDGETVVFTNFDGKSPQVTIGPKDQQVAEEIERLPAGVREMTRNYFQYRRRPLTDVATELQSQQEREVTSSLEGRKPDATARIENTRDGRRAFRVTGVSEMTNPDFPIARWETSQLILDQTYLLVEERQHGFRKDGLIYERVRQLVGEEVFVADGQRMAVFSPGSFPADTTYRHVSPKERVELLRKAANAEKK